ncbi:MAG TPA: hypothetical protein VIC62_04375, partial [Nakamurella sp.]
MRLWQVGAGTGGAGTGGAGTCRAGIGPRRDGPRRDRGRRYCSSSQAAKKPSELVAQCSSIVVL